MILKVAAGFIDFSGKSYSCTFLNRHLGEDHQTIMHGEVNISGAITINEPVDKLMAVSAA